MDNDKAIELAEELEIELVDLREALQNIKTILYDKAIPQIIKDRARMYPIAHIEKAIDCNHEYLGGSMFTLQDIIDDLRDCEEVEE